MTKYSSLGGKGLIALNVMVSLIEKAYLTKIIKISFHRFIKTVPMYIPSRNSVRKVFTIPKYINL